MQRNAEKSPEFSLKGFSGLRHVGLAYGFPCSDPRFAFLPRCALVILGLIQVQRKVERGLSKFLDEVVDLSTEFFAKKNAPTVKILEELYDAQHRDSVLFPLVRFG
jgi:hypothetical protein